MASRRQPELSQTLSRTRRVLFRTSGHARPSATYLGLGRHLLSPPPRSASAPKRWVGVGARKTTSSLERVSQSLGFALAERRPVRILLLLRAGLHTSYLYDLLPALTVFGLGLAATVAPLTATMLADADPDRRATLYDGNQAPGRDGKLLDPALDPARVRARYTNPAHARRGVGRQILSLCEAAAASEGFTRLELMSTLSDEPLYTAYGFDRSND